MLTVLAMMGCDQQSKYDVIVLQSKVKQLESQLANLEDEVGIARDRVALQKNVNRLQEELIELQRALEEVKSNPQILKVDSRPQAEPVVEEPIRQGPTPEQIAEAIVSFENAGAKVEKDEEGNVVAVRASEFPVEQAVM
ncbi:MAG: hypothetical protein GY768_27310, partial [Planctomycetaceae bacterium]|nr:hypothetical protein [Planctomycetaceae bacterium]